MNLKCEENIQQYIHCIYDTIGTKIANCFFYNFELSAPECTPVCLVSFVLLNL
jgi:hypothetical protein